jgi:hypothetical protein
MGRACSTNEVRAVYKFIVETPMGTMIVLRRPGRFARIILKCILKGILGYGIDSFV